MPWTPYFGIPYGPRILEFLMNFLSLKSLSLACAHPIQHLLLVPVPVPVLVVLQAYSSLLLIPLTSSALILLHHQPLLILHPCSIHT